METARRTSARWSTRRRTRVPATKEEVVEKFRANAANTIGSVKAERIIELVDTFETLETLDELFECLR
jgi:hypothetical protein